MAKRLWSRRLDLQNRIPQDVRVLTQRFAEPQEARGALKVIIGRLGVPVPQPH